MSCEEHVTATPYHHLVRLRPRADTIYLSQGYTVFAGESNGFIADGAEHGFFVHETRLLSRYGYTIDHQPPQLIACSNIAQHTWMGYYIAPPPGDSDAVDQGSGQVPDAAQYTIELRLSRYVSDGLHEDVDLTNYTQQPVSFTLQLDVDADFADQAETRDQRQQHGQITRAWSAVEAGVWELAIDYRAEHAYDCQGHVGTARLHRAITLQVEHATSPPAYADGCLSFHVELAPHATWHACINMIPLIDGVTMPPLTKCQSFAGVHNDRDRRRELFLSEATAFSTPQSETLAHAVVGALEQATRDLAALRLYELDQGERAWTIAAGLPIYTAVFGRDTLTAAWQAGLASAAMMRGTLPELARLQGRETDDWRDEQPGRMIHEAHTGPLAMLNLNPRQRYYGSITTSGFYAVVVSELWHWTGDKELVWPFLRPALDALRWLDTYGDLDGDGFYEYKTRSKQGVEHQAWKDSGDSMVYEDGSQAPAPVATCEEQGFVYLAKLHLSELLWWFGDVDQAKRLYHEANELKQRFNAAFWMEGEGFFAMGLDPQKRQLRSISSNPGHCLATAIADAALVLPTVTRLFADDLFSGWGIRTLSSKHPAYNPYSYHRGSVWPVEHGTFALGLMRYGLHEQVELLCRAQFEAATHFEYYRLPELFSGHQRDIDHPFPALYPRTNAPQAWSSSAIFCLVQSLLGLYPYAPLNMLLIDPHLPAWLPEITLRNLRVGEAQIAIRFYRREDGTSAYEVLDKRGSLHVVRQPSPWSLTASFGERLKDVLTSFLPGM
jgi:glycogen debranching enzyme